MTAQRQDQEKVVHMTITCRSCSFNDLNTSKGISSLLLDIAKATDMQVITHKIHQFEPWGITGFVLLAESHLAIHTWPERGLAIIDLLTCKSTKIEPALNLIKERLPLSRIEYCKEVIKK